MYELRPESIKTFVEDTTIRLPRFQRKPTWGPRKSFNLAMSLYRGYPLGLVVIKRSSEEGKLRKFLLDGRQRRDALMAMREPEEVYGWAKVALRFNSTSTEESIRDQFDRYVETYFGVEDWERETDNHSELAPELSASPEFEEEAPTDDDDLSDDELGVESANAADDGAPDVGLQDLLKLILLVHPRRKLSSGFTDPFHFDKWIEGLDFVVRDPDSGKAIVMATRLPIWLASRRKYAEAEDRAYPPSLDEFTDWLVEAGTLRDGVTLAKVRGIVETRWAKIHLAMTLLETIDRKLQESQIGYLEIRDTSASDERKIFEIINTAGTPLTAAEILSARSIWNVEVANPAQRIQKDVKELYESMKIPSDGRVVRWDVAATVRSRLNLPAVLGKS